MRFNVKAWLAVLVKVAPIVIQVIPGVPPFLVPVIVKAIEEAEHAGVSGPEKKELVMQKVKASATAIPETTLAKVSEAVDLAVGTTNNVTKVATA